MTRIRENPSSRNRLGAWALALAAISVVAYAVTAVISGSRPLDGKFWALSQFVSPAAAMASVVVGVIGLLRARGDAGGLGLAIAGVAVGGLLTAWFVIWFVGLLLDSGGRG